MECDRVLLLLNGYLDTELDLVNSLAIEEHLQGCSSCSRKYQALTALQAAARTPELYYQAPDRLKTRIRAAVKKEDRSSRPSGFFSVGWFSPLAALAVILLFMLGFFVIQGRLLAPPQEPRLAQEVQSAHVRSLMASHLTDILSSDKHTVKPWFSGKLDFSPPVTDLKEQGFPLVGGRLDYLDGQPVAALVYQGGKHLINLFIWPVQDTAGGQAQYSSKGYNIIHWNEGGLTYWAVSDLNPEELASFVQRIQRANR